MTQWYYADRNRQRQGPIEAATLADLYRHGQVDTATLVWRAGMAQWQVLGDFVEELGLLPPATTTPAWPEPAEPPAAAELGLAASEPEPAAAPGASAASGPGATLEAGTGEVSAAATPGFEDTHPHAIGATVAAFAAAAPATRAAEIVYAGFWKRVAACLIDSLAIGVPVGIVALLVSFFPATMMGIDLEDGGADPTALIGVYGIYYLVTYLGCAIVFGFFHSRTSLLATPGKLAVGIKVVRSDGRAISFWRGFGRYFAYILSSIPLGIGLLLAAFTQRKQALHDMICDTVVVDKWAFTGHPERQRRELGTVTIVVLAVYALFLLLGIAVLGIAFATLFSAIGS